MTTKDRNFRSTFLKKSDRKSSILSVLMRQLLILIALSFAFDPWSRAGETNEILVRATAALEAGTARAQADPMHPIFHVTAPAQWINDPNGPIFHKGYYHLFYQLHPFSDGSGPKY